MKAKPKKIAKKKVTVVKKTVNLKKPAKSRKVLAVKKTLRRGSGQVKKVIKKISVKPKKKVIVKKIARKIIRKLPVKKTLRHGSGQAKKHVIKKHVVNKPIAHKEFAAEALFKAKIKVIGIGGGGGSIVSEIGRSLEKATFVIADTDIRALKKRSGIKYMWFGEELTHGLGTGVNVELAKQAAESARDKIGSIFKDQDIIIFVASLGGGLGSGATQVFADVAKQFGGITLGIFTMPFKFEGNNKYRIAQNALRVLRQSLNVSLVIPNEKIFKIIDNSTPITNAFSIVNKSLIESLESLIDLIYNPGVINIDFADLRTILRGVGNTAFLNTIEESGKDRVEKICENIFKNPLLQNNNFKAEKILFNIAGSDNLSMFEVEKISSHIANANAKAKIIFGISKNPKLNNRIKTTILMTGGQTEEKIAKEVAIKKPEPVKIEVEEKVNELVKKEVEAIKKEIKKIAPVAAVKVKPRVPSKKTKKAKPSAKKEPADTNGRVPVSITPVFNVPDFSTPIMEQEMETEKVRLMGHTESAKKTIRRSGLEIKKAEELQEKKKIAQEKEWEIPAFLRKVKFKS